MKPIRLLTFLLLSTTLVLSACAPQTASACESTDAFVEALRADGAQVEVAEQLEQEFFSVPAQRLVVNGDDVQVWEYASRAAAQSDASQITGAGYIIGLAMIDWIETPHFFQCGNLIVLYLGQNLETISQFENLLGEQIEAE